MAVVTLDRGHMEVETLRILLVEDDDSFAAMVREFLLKGAKRPAGIKCDLTRAATAEEAAAYLETTMPDAIILDLMLPDSEGLDTFSQIKVETADVPIVVLTGVDDEELADAIMEQGAQDYLIKSEVNSQALQRVLRYAIMRQHLNRDLTAHAKRVQTRELDLRHVFHQYLDGLVLTDSKDRVILANQSACRLLALGPSVDLVGKPFIYTMSETEQDLNLSLPDSTKRTCTVRRQSIQWSGEEAILYSFQDVTALRSTEERQHQHLENLEAMIAVRTRELTDANRSLQDEIEQRETVEEELRLAVDNLARSNIELERFAYIASHDLREPLRQIINYCDLLKRKHSSNVDEQGITYLQFSIDNATRLYGMVNSLLEYSKLSLSSGKFANHESSTLVQEAMEQIRLSIEEAEAQIEMQNLPRIYCNGLLIMQVFQNLISNAIKFSGGRKPRIKITCEWVNDRPEWLFKVQDNGIGMKMDQADRIFQIFHRLQRTSEHAGHGIGLAICRKVVQHHGGKIWVESKPGKGSTFYFSISRNLMGEATVCDDGTERFSEMRQLRRQARQQDQSVETSDEDSEADSSNDPKEKAE